MINIKDFISKVFRGKQKQSDAIYITTTLPYVNASPHVGFALEIVQADALARFYRAQGKEVFFNTGTDEHGQKIFEAAKKAGKSPQDYVDFYASEFLKLKEALNLSYDKFIRTTDEKHKRAAQELWKKALTKGDIYKKKYKGLYCVGCEAFVRESDLDEKGECPNHPGKALQEIEEENYFFALTKYKKELKAYLQKKESIIPEKRKKEALKILESLEDISISRSKERLSWGVPVPEDNSQVMYVWFDALTNYISTLGFPVEENQVSQNIAEGTRKGFSAVGNQALQKSADGTRKDAESLFEKFWQKGKTIQLAGKDQVKFQSIIWQAMLISADIKPTDTVFYHGFVTSDGQKMSKSLGNVISPYDLVERYGTDATRYILLRHIHPTEDSDLSWSKMGEWYTANLVNGLGNLTARIMKMAESYLDEPAQVTDTALDSAFVSAMQDFRFNEAMDIVWQKISELDQKITETEPFKLIKLEPEKAKQIVKELVQGLSEVAEHLESLLPRSAKAIKDAIKQNKKPESLFKRLND